MYQPFARPSASAALRYDLPAEVWKQIFDLAADEDIIFGHGVPTSMVESAWFKNVFNEWTLRTPQEAINQIQRRSYATKKAIISTCRKWKELGAEFLYRCLFFDDPSKLHLLCTLMDAGMGTSTTQTQTHCWWTRRIHLTRYYASTARGAHLRDIERALISVLERCPNLEIFVVDWPMAGSGFGGVANALGAYLRTVSWTLPAESMARAIWALDELPSLLAVSLTFDEGMCSDDSDGRVPLGAAEGMQLTLPALQQLTLRGHVVQFVEQAYEWALPSLRALTLDLGGRRSDLPDILTFLQQHGQHLRFLDVNCGPAVDIARVLDVCPRLEQLAFNADWRVLPTEDAPPSGTAGTEPRSALVMYPHEHIRSVGLHGLIYAFGVGHAAAYASAEPFRATIVQRSNDLNVAALNKLNFPRLERVRSLSRPLLLDLNREGGPSQGPDGGYARWERWWSAFTNMGVRLEDCTGQVLGTLPPEDNDGDAKSDGSATESDSEFDEEDEDEQDEQDGEEGDGVKWEITPLPVDGTAGMQELRQLLQECRVMSEEGERERRSSLPLNAFLHGMLGDFPPPSRADNEDVESTLGGETLVEGGT
ncbi:hypothetical protein FISHEDRAFT_43360 [Fistulina hepatica ATCC 64428]|uniref:F-box domain-containing protein n=1 Tax=Fistulina hepatica ATCC 64428 TaxID=1128425 RepID=A0A0D7ABN5_9AGAR|nr:hypothetical protein FISHEDRAFT_43360 [Fistulina hepatica ATCC 64428]